MKLHLNTAFCAVLGTSLSPALGADVLAEGYTTTALVQPGNSVLELASGGLLGFDGSSVDLLDANGTFIETIYTLPGVFFSGAFAVNASETRALVGESSTGDLFAVDLVAKTGAPIGNMVFNFSAAFDSESTAIVSAATCGFGCGNDLIRIDLDSGVQTPLALVAGASGPVATDPSGNLFYVSVSGAFPAPAGSASVLRFDAARLDGAMVLSESDAVVVAGGLDGASALDYDAQAARLYLAENNFSTGLNRLVEIAVGSGDVTTLVDGDTFNSIGGVQFLAGSGPGVFEAFQPASSGRVVYTSTDFATFNDRLGLDPARAQLALSGPGVGGAGAVTVNVTGAPANGFVLFAACPIGDASAFEIALSVGGLPLIVTALSPTTTSFDSFVGNLDGSGSFTTAFANNAGLVGVFATQAFLVDAAGSSLVATTTMANL